MAYYIKINFYNLVFYSKYFYISVCILLLVFRIVDKFMQNYEKVCSSYPINIHLKYSNDINLEINFVLEIGKEILYNSEYNISAS